MLPSFYLLNARPLLPKVDELTALLSTNPADLVAITESWLNDDIDSGLLSVRGFNLFRNDRVLGRGGGICVYIKDDVPCKRRVDLENPDFECLWFSLRPERLPRPLSGIVICVVYHPPGRTVQDHKDLDEYLINTTDQLRNKDPDHGLVFPGDFNDFDIRNITSNHSLKQIVNQPTRGNATLDLIITNLHNLYSCPSILAPLGSSDHNVVQWLPTILVKTLTTLATIL